jgi:hypothetical protein
VQFTLDQGSWNVGDYIEVVVVRDRPHHVRRRLELPRLSSMSAQQGFAAELAAGFEAQDQVTRQVLRARQAAGNKVIPCNPLC